MNTKLNMMFGEILLFAERNQVCLRKAVGCAAIGFDEHMNPLTIGMVHNGPSREGHKCSNEVGNCGCSHSEPRLVRDMLKLNNTLPDMPLVMLCTYSPCTNCANIVIDSQLFCGIIYDILTEHDKRGAEFLKQDMGVLTVKEMNEMSEKQLSDKIKEWISS